MSIYGSNMCDYEFISILDHSLTAATKITLSPVNNSEGLGLLYNSKGSWKPIHAPRQSASTTYTQATLNFLLTHKDDCYNFQLMPQSCSNDRMAIQIIGWAGSHASYGNHYSYVLFFTPDFFAPGTIGKSSFLLQHQAILEKFLAEKWHEFPFKKHFLPVQLWKSCSGKHKQKCPKLKGWKLQFSLRGHESTGNFQTGLWLGCHLNWKPKAQTQVKCEFWHHQLHTKSIDPWVNSSDKNHKSKWNFAHFSLALLNPFWFSVSHAFHVSKMRFSLSHCKFHIEFQN